MHAIDRHIKIYMAMKSFQHKAIATEGNDHIRFFWRAITVSLCETFCGFLSGECVRGNDTNLAERHCETSDHLA